jgi:non-ribosomal peptide synthetase component E (peptide arylation enzyme)
LPDADRGELVCAVIRRSTRHRQVSLTELCSHLAQQGLMKQKWPEKIVYVDDYPLTGLGKISRRELVEAITERVRTAVS